MSSWSFSTLELEISSKNWTFELVLVTVISIYHFLGEFCHKFRKLWERPRQIVNHEEIVIKVQMTVNYVKVQTTENCVKKVQQGSFFSELRKLIATESYEK